MGKVVIQLKYLNIVKILLDDINAVILLGNSKMNVTLDILSIFYLFHTYTHKSLIITWMETIILKDYLQILCFGEQLIKRNLSFIHNN